MSSLTKDGTCVWENLRLKLLETEELNTRLRAELALGKACPDGYEHNDNWVREGKDFNIEIVHFTRNGQHMWNVYAYIFQMHLLFDSIGPTGGIDQDVLLAMPLHKGCTAFKAYHNSLGMVTCYSVGSDYNHCGDDYGAKSKLDEVPTVLEDAEALYTYLMEARYATLGS